MGGTAGCNLRCGAGNGHPEDREVRFLTGVYDLIPAELLALRPVVELDLGCGVGSFTAELAKRYPERTILAADVMIGRLRKLVRRMHRMELDNLILLRSEARYLVGLALPDASIDRIHLLCPDPWPKGRHRGHRLLTSDFTARLHRVLKPEGIFHFSSDDEAYCGAVHRVITASRLFVEAPEAVEDIADVRSDFELRWLEEGKPVHHAAWKKIPPPPHTVGH